MSKRETYNEAEFDSKSIRPKYLNQFIGQQDIKEQLYVALKSAQKRSTVVDHIIFYGPPGLGKTTLSEILAKEMNVDIRVSSGPAITKAGELAAILTSLQPNDILFIDEIHRLNISIEEVLYSAMEDFNIDIVVGEGPAGRSIRLELPKFTLVGATTRLGLLSHPLRDRFGINLRLQFYTVEDLCKIVKRSAEILEITFTESAVRLVAESSRGTPRIANAIVRRLRDYITVANNSTISESFARSAMDKLGIAELGLDKLDLDYLNIIYTLYKGGPVGIDSLSAMLSETKDTIEDVVEPYLMQKGFIYKSPKGRMMTEAGIEIFIRNNHT